VNSVLAPVDDQGLADEEEHDRDLGDREETPNRGLLHQIGGDDTCQIRTEDEEENSLNDHAPLFIECEEGSEHEEGVDGRTRDDVGGVSHGNGPGQVIVSSESAKLLSSEPLGGGLVSKSLWPNTRNHPAGKQHCTTNETQSLDNHIFVQILLVLGEGGIDDVAEIGLEADVQESQNCEHLVNQGVADRGIDVRGNEEVLDGLEELHGEEEEHTRGQLGVVRLGPDPP